MGKVDEMIEEMDFEELLGCTSIRAQSVGRWRVIAVSSVSSVPASARVADV